MKLTHCLSVAGLLLGLLGTLLVAGRAAAQGAVERRFEQLDRNKDGKVTPDELPAAVLFKRLDLDGNGEISRVEAIQALLRRGLGAGAKPENEAMSKAGAVALNPEIRQGPKPVRSGDYGVGRLVPDLALRDLAGKTCQLGDLARDHTVVLAMTSTSCPLSRKYLPTLVELTKNSGQRVNWVLVNPVASDDPAEMQAASVQFSDRIIYVHDREGELAARLGARTTTDVIVLDSARTIVYHGAIDDQYGLGYSREAPRSHYLADALAALAQGGQPSVAATDAPGCTLDLPARAQAATDLTYHNRISRIMQRHCVECHRERGVGPFPLDSYKNLVAHAGMIEQVVERRVMPPWFAVDSPSNTNSPPGHSPWANDRSLAQADRQDLLNWLRGGKPEGDHRDAPQPMQFDDGWLIGKPDSIYQFASPVPVKATGVMPYQDVLVETNLPEDKWVRAIEVQPGARGVVHHVLVFVQDDEQSDGDPGDDAAAERGGFWGIYVPGNSSLVYPEGFAKRIPKGAKLRFQMHYTPNGTATTDQTRIGLIWAEEPPRHEVRVAGLVNARIRIPPGAENHREEALLRLPVDATVLGFLPHMHLRGKACRYEVTRANGQTTTLLDIPRYDFNWQLLYRYHEPLALQSGDTLRFTAWFDNSDQNPANPDATKWVHWGPQTYDEMQLGYVEYFLPGAKPGEASASIGRRRRLGRTEETGRPGPPALDIEAIFRRLDRNGDGELTPDELPAAQRDNLMRLDVNQDEVISLEEAKRFRR